MRLSGIYLNENNPKDKAIIDFINGSAIKPTQLIRQGLFALVTGSVVSVPVQASVVSNNASEEFIDDDLDCIDLGNY